MSGMNSMSGMNTRSGAGISHGTARPWAVNNRDRTWRSAAPAGTAEPGPSGEPTDAPPALAFHRTMPGYARSALTPVPALVDAWGVRQVLVKDESNRMGLPAFKILGASWGAACALSAAAGVPPVSSLAELRALAEGLGASGREITLVTATDGNHGRALARMAKLLGVRARIVLAGGLPASVAEAIADEGATVTDSESTYDDAVAQAAASCTGPDDLLVQDMSWDGYEDVPRAIVEGYSTLFAEIDEQRGEDGQDAKGDDATAERGRSLVVVPAGVGSLLQAGVQHFRSAQRSDLPVLLSAEPVGAACVVASVAAGEPVSAPATEATTMAGLNCGTISAAAWPVIRAGLDAAIAVTDAESAAAQQILQDAGVPAGPCGSATAAAVTAALEVPGGREVLGLDADATVVLVSTDGV